MVYCECQRKIGKTNEIKEKQGALRGGLIPSKDCEI